jgi:membrane protein
MRKNFKNLKSRLKRFFKDVLVILQKPQMAVLPGHLAFFLVLSIVPILSLISFFGSMFNISSDLIARFLTKSFSPEVANLLLPNNLSNVTGWKFLIIFIITFYIASNGMNSVIVASNAIYGKKNGSFLRREIKSFAMNLIVIAIILVLLVFPVFGELILNLLKNFIVKDYIINNIIWVYTLVQGPLLWIIIFFLVKLLYIMAPDKEIPDRNTNYGSLFTTVFWVLITEVYSLYVTKIADFSSIYGGIAMVAVLMLWIYILSAIFTIGLALNHTKEKEGTGVLKVIEKDA